jgi:hypothetical protein
MIERSRIGTPSAKVPSPGEQRTSADALRPVQRTNAGWKDTAADERGGPALRPAQTFAEPLARHWDDPIFRHIPGAKVIYLLGPARDRAGVSHTATRQKTSPPGTDFA